MTLLTKIFYPIIVARGYQMKLPNKKAVVTGANRSIGSAIAIAFAQEGADVLISYRSDEAGAKKTVQAIERFGRAAKAVHADFSDMKGVDRFFKEALDFLGCIDILVNNAAGFNTTEFLALTVDEFEQLLKINVTAPLFLSQLVAKHMIEKRIEGNIINISATTGDRPYPSRTAHSSAKAALNMLTKSMALELAEHNIRVNAIAPGSTPYDINASDPTSLKDIPLQRFGKPEDQARAAVYLASEDTSWMTGQILTIDGGHSLSF